VTGRSLSARLIVASIAAVLLAVLVFGVGARIIVSSQMRSSLDESLRRRAIEVARLSVSAPAVLTAPGALESPVSGRQLSVEVLDRNEAIVARSLALGAKLLPRGPELTAALRGTEVASDTYIAELSPAMDVCVPSARPGSAFCTTLDLLELQRQVQRIRVGEKGYALAFDRTGRLLAAGSGPMRAAVLSGDPVAESPLAAALFRGTPAPARLRNGEGRDVLAGWASLPALGWTIAVEQPADEALRGARTALGLLALGAAVILLLSITIGYVLVRRMLAALELEERFRTAGKIAAGVTHDLGHRLTILRQIEELAAMNDPDYLPRIRESLASEVATLRRFVGDFSDLTREAKPQDFLPIELNAFADSILAGARGYASEANVGLEVKRAPSELWVRGDRYLLERAALNLTRNAIEASKPGSRVRLRVDRSDGGAVLAVEDQGAGIPPDRIATLFESFSSTKRSGVHLGMGLPNVRRIVAAHGGAISVKSKPGEGTTFRLSLPVNGPQSSSPSAPATMP